MTTLEYNGTYTIPVWAVCPLEYGSDNYDELTEKEIRLVLSFERQFTCPIYDWKNSRPFFSWYNDIDQLGGDCVEVDIYENKHKNERLRQ
jgi:hypothetical protein